MTTPKLFTSAWVEPTPDQAKKAYDRVLQRLKELMETGKQFETVKKQSVIAVDSQAKSVEQGDMDPSHPKVMARVKRTATILDGLPRTVTNPERIASVGRNIPHTTIHKRSA